MEAKTKQSDRLRWKCRTLTFELLRTYFTIIYSIYIQVDTFPTRSIFGIFIYCFNFHNSTSLQQQNQTILWCIHTILPGEKFAKNHKKRKRNAKVKDWKGNWIKNNGKSFSILSNINKRMEIFVHSLFVFFSYFAT